MRTESTLARHQAAIKERLIDAVNAGLSHLSEEELMKMPEELRHKVRVFMAELTRVGGPEGSVHATVSEMSVGEAQIMVDRFLALNYEVEQIPHR